MDFLPWCHRHGEGPAFSHFSPCSSTRISCLDNWHHPRLAQQSYKYLTRRNKSVDPCKADIPVWRLICQPPRLWTQSTANSKHSLFNLLSAGDAHKKTRCWSNVGLMLDQHQTNVGSIYRVFKVFSYSPNTVFTRFMSVCGRFGIFIKTFLRLYFLEVSKLFPRNNHILIQCWFNFGPATQTVDQHVQHQTSISTVSLVWWDLLTFISCATSIV